MVLKKTSLHEIASTNIYYNKVCYNWQVHLVDRIITIIIIKIECVSGVWPKIKWFASIYNNYY